MRRLRAGRLATILTGALALAATTMDASAQNYAGPSVRPAQNAAGPAGLPGQNAAGPAGLPGQNAAGPPPAGVFASPQVGPPGLVWIPAHAVWNGYRRVWIGGHWDRAGIERRDRFVPGRRFPRG